VDESSPVNGGGPLSAIALAEDGHVLWQVSAGYGNTYRAVDMFAAALRAPRSHLVAALEFSNDQDFADRARYREHGPLPAAADGNAVLFFAPGLEGSEARNRQGAVYRLAGRRVRALARFATSPAALAVAGRRFLVVGNNGVQCCSHMPTWSHDGTRLAWIYRQGRPPGTLFTIGADGKGDRQLATHASLPSWSPDDTRLVFEREEAKQRRAVYRIDAAGGHLKRLAAGSGPAWSPDGTRIAFVRGNHLYSIDPEGRGETRLTTTVRATAGPLAWSPDSRSVAVSRGGWIWSIRVDGTGEIRLAQGGQPAWSPNGARVAYAGRGGIGVVAADGQGATRLTSSAEYFDGSPAWSPDSARIAWVRVAPPGDAELWLMNADGKAKHRLAPKLNLVSPQWAPNGASIVAGDYYEDNYLVVNGGIRLVSPSDGKAKRIAPPLHSAVEVRDVVTGRLINRFRTDGHTRAAALGPTYVTLLLDHQPGMRIELYNLNGQRRNAFGVRSSVNDVASAGDNIIFADRRLIRRLDARTGIVSTVASVPGSWRPVAPTIQGHRVVWAENNGRTARIRMVTAP